MKGSRFSMIVLFLGTIGFVNASFATDASQTDQTTQQGMQMTQQAMPMKQQAMPMMQPMFMMQENMHNCAQYKKLTAEQKTKVDKLMQDFHNKMMSLRDQMWTKQEALNKQFATSTPDESTVNSIAKDLTALHDQMFTAHIQARLEMAKVGFSSAECWKYPMMKRWMGQSKEMMHGPMSTTPAQ